MPMNLILHLICKPAAFETNSGRGGSKEHGALTLSARGGGTLPALTFPHCSKFRER
jgi:hypothetical protein